MRLTENFTASEFDSPGVGGVSVSLDLVERLQDVRRAIRRPIKITSGVRSVEHNKSVGGSDASSHITGLGCDIAIPDSTYRALILPELLHAFNRVGIYGNHIHVDIDPHKTQGVVWVEGPK